MCVCLSVCVSVCVQTKILVLNIAQSLICHKTPTTTNQPTIVLSHALMHQYS